MAVPTTARPAANSGQSRLGLRAAARALDSLLLAGTAGGLGAVVGFDLPWLIATGLGVYGYFVVFDATSGATPGKLAVGLRVRASGGGRVPVGAALAREAFVLVGAIPFVGPVLAVAAWLAIVQSVRSSEDGRGIHDRLAGGTQVTSAR